MRGNNRHTEPILRVEDLVVSYYKKEVLQGTSLHVMPGEIVALIGTNGSGKSTLLKTIFGLTRANSGRIILNNLDVMGKSPEDMVQLGIGFMIQGGQVFQSLTVKEHLQLAVQAGGRAKLEEKAETVWQLFPEMRKMLNKRAGLLSGGERQMLAFAMLLVQDVKLWLLDEPSGGLAPGAVRSLMDLIARQKAEKGLTVLLAEQNLREGLRIADRMYILRNGKASVEEAPRQFLDVASLEQIF